MLEKLYLKVAVCMEDIVGLEMTKTFNVALSLREIDSLEEDIEVACKKDSWRKYNVSCDILGFLADKPDKAVTKEEFFNDIEEAVSFQEKAWDTIGAEVGNTDKTADEEECGEDDEPNQELLVRLPFEHSEMLKQISDMYGMDTDTAIAAGIDKLYQDILWLDTLCRKGDACEEEARQKVKQVSRTEFSVDDEMSGILKRVAEIQNEDEETVFNNALDIGMYLMVSGMLKEDEDKIKKSGN